MATNGTRGGGGAILPTGCTKPPVAKVDEGKAVVCATETTAMVCVVPLWMVVVVNNLRTGPLVGVKGIENLTVAALLTTLAATLVCVVETSHYGLQISQSQHRLRYTVSFITEGFPHSH